MPTAALFAVLLFVMAEIAVTVIWQPRFVGTELYAKHSLAYDYAYASDFPRLFGEGDVLRYYPTEYADLQGFELARHKGDREIRIFVLGSSVTRAADVPTEKAYPAQLEAILRERHPEYEWTVLNLGAAGFGSSRMRVVAEKMIHLRPDVFVVHPHGTNEYEDERDAHYRAELYSGLNGVFLRSHLVTLLKKLEGEWLEMKTLGVELPPNAEQIAGQDPENLQRWMRTMTANLQRIEELAEEHGVGTAYVGRAERDMEDYRGEQVVRLNAPLRAEKHFVDVASVFSHGGSRHEPSELFLDWTHYTELGHRLVAEALYQQVRPGSAIFDQVVAARSDGDLTRWARRSSR